MKSKKGETVKRIDEEQKNIPLTYKKKLEMEGSEKFDKMIKKYKPQY